MKTDVVVIGAGFTGLSAAWALQQAGIDFILLEARDDVGGRVASAINGLGERIDTGGQFFCDDMPEISALAAAHGKTKVDALFAGHGLVQPSMPENDLDELYGEMVAIRDRANELDPNDPAIATLSVQAWTDMQPDTEEARRGFLGLIEGLWCMPVDRLPLWYLVSSDRRITNEISELQYFLGETMHSLAEGLGHALGSRLRLGEPVLSIAHNAESAVTIATKAGVYAARRVIVAVPPVSAGRIVYDPPLPAGLQKALSAWESGRVIKAMIRYDRPFWRESGLSGSIFFLDTLGLYACDASVDDAHARLVMFAGGGIASRWRALGSEGIKAEIIDRLEAAFGPEARAPLDIMLHDWSDDRWSGGGYSDVIIDFEAKDAEETLRRGLPRVAFASSELSPSYPGYIEGAIIAGRAAAANCIEALRPAKA